MLQLSSEAISRASKRDLRIDLFRGLALYMMFVDHVRDNPLILFTFQRIGFSDAAEIFIFLSGLGCGIAYTRTVASGGFPALFKSVLLRTLRICAFYYLTGAAAIALVVTLKTTGLWQISQNFEAIDPSLATISRSPLDALWATLSLVSPSSARLLVTYIIFTPIIVPLFFIGIRHSAYLTVAVSGLIWLIVQPLPHSLMSEHFYDNLAFDPFAWQFLFVIGMFLGARYDRPAPRRSAWFARLVPLAWTVVVGCLLYKATVRLGPHFGIDVAWMRLSPDTIEEMKKELSASRLVHFLSVALLVSTYLKSGDAILRLPILSPLMTSGRRSIEVFCLSVILAYLGDIILFTTHYTMPAILIMNAAAFALMAFTAYALTRKQSRSAARNELQSFATNAILARQPGALNASPSTARPQTPADRQRHSRG
jgi:hypothetical protein